MRSHRVAVVGGGIFGVSAALELNARGHRVSLFDPGPLPHPLAASTDISKVIRMEYGADEAYMAVIEEARDRWQAWNAEWTEEGLGPLYHETGVLMACRAPMGEGGFEDGARGRAVVCSGHQLVGSDVRAERVTGVAVYIDRKPWQRCGHQGICRC